MQAEKANPRIAERRTLTIETWQVLGASAPYIGLTELKHTFSVRGRILAERAFSSAAELLAVHAGKVRFRKLLRRLDAHHPEQMFVR